MSNAVIMTIGQYSKNLSIFYASVSEKPEKRGLACREK